MTIFPLVVYLLCFATSLVCLWLLIRNFKASGSRLLLWAALAFVGFALNNALLFVDVILLPTQVDLQVWRHVTALMAVSVLIVGFVWEAD